MPAGIHPLLMEWDQACERVVQAEIRYTGLSRARVDDDLLAAAQAELLNARAAFAAINAQIADEVKDEIGGRLSKHGAANSGS